MPTIEFTEDERAVLAAFLRDATVAERFSLSPRLRPIKSVLRTVADRPCDWCKG